MDNGRKQMNVQVLDSAFKVAFSEAIKKVGVETFKRSSFFGSNDSDRGEPVAWQYRYRPAGTKVWSDWGDGKAPDMRGGSYETEERPLYAHPPAPKGQSDA